MKETLFNCSLWGDEAFSAVLAQKPLFSMIQVVSKDTSPPLMYFILHFWFKIFGSSEVSIRSLSLSFYLGTTVVVYLIGRQLFSKKTGFLAAVLTFFNPFLFPYAFEGRMYFCLLFFTILSFFFLIKKNNLGYILASVAALYSHHFAFMVLAAQFFWLLISKRKLIIKPFLIIGLLYLPWLYPLYKQTTLVSSGFWLGKPTLEHLGQTFKNFAYEKIFLLALILLTLRKWSKKQTKKDLLLILWLITPAFLTFLISQGKTSIYYERYFLYSVPPLMLLLTSALRKPSYLLILIMLFFYINASYLQFIQPHKKPFRQFANWIKENINKETFIINYNGKAHHLWESYYYGIKAPLYSSGELPFFVGTAQMTENDVIHQLPEKPIIGVITSDRPESLSLSGYQASEYYQNDSLYFVWFIKN